MAGLEPARADPRYSQAARRRVCARGASDLAAASHRSRRHRRFSRCSSSGTCLRARPPLRDARAGQAPGRCSARRSTPRERSQHFVSGLWDLLKGGATRDARRGRFEPSLFRAAHRQPGATRVQRAAVDGSRSGCAPRPGVRSGARAVSAHVVSAARSPRRPRRAEAFDLAGLARDHLVDVLRAALSRPRPDRADAGALCAGSLLARRSASARRSPREPGAAARGSGGGRRRAGDSRVRRARVTGPA